MPAYAKSIVTGDRASMCTDDSGTASASQLASFAFDTPTTGSLVATGVAGPATSAASAAEPGDSPVVASAAPAGAGITGRACVAAASGGWLEAASVAAAGCAARPAKATGDTRS